METSVSGWHTQGRLSSVMTHSRETISDDTLKGDYRQWWHSQGRLSSVMTHSMETILIDDTLKGDYRHGRHTQGRLLSVSDSQWWLRCGDIISTLTDTDLILVTSHVVYTDTCTFLFDLTHLGAQKNFFWKSRQKRNYISIKVKNKLDRELVRHT